MHGLIEYIILMFEVVQVALTIYFFFLLYREGLKKYACAFFVIIVLFVCLKFRFIPYDLGGYLDRGLWGTYNVLFIGFYIYLLTHDHKKTWIR